MHSYTHTHAYIHTCIHTHAEAGEDGIVAYILEQLGRRLSAGLCFEFGAWDGIFASNCRWWYEQGWAGIMAELDAEKFKSLEVTCRNLPDLVLGHVIFISLSLSLCISLSLSLSLSLCVCVCVCVCVCECVFECLREHEGAC